MKNSYLLIAGILLLGIQAACVKEPQTALPQVTSSQPLLSILKNNFSFSMFYTALARTGLDKTLEGKGPFTVLVPDNDAFAASGISADSLSRIDTATLKKIISYHIIPESIPYASIPQTIDFTYKSLVGLPLYFSVPVPGPQQRQAIGYQILHINGATVNKLDIAASNGYVMDLNRVLNYPASSVKAYLESQPQYSYFVQALKQFGLFNMLDKPGPFVVFAPTNNDFLQNGIDETGVAQLDTLTYKKFLFSASILSPQLFFSTDFIDAPMPPTFPAYANPDVLLLFNVFQADPSNTFSYGVAPYNYLDIEANLNPPYYGYPFIYGSYSGNSVPIIDPDHLAQNGVVHGISDLAVYPDSVKIHR